MMMILLVQVAREFQGIDAVHSKARSPSYEGVLEGGMGDVS